MRGLSIAIGLFIVGVMLLSGFSSMSNAMAVNQNSSSTGTLYIALQEDMANYNYFNIPTNTVWKSDIIGWGWDSLYTMDESGAMVPYLAQNATFWTNNLTLIVHIRQGVYFVWPGNGTPAYELTAKDVMFSYFAERYGTTVSGTAFTIPFDDMKYGYVTYYEMLRHVKFINNFTVEFTMYQQYGEFFMDTMTMPIIPWKIWANHLTVTGLPYDNNSTVFINPNGSTNGVVNTQWTQSPLATMGTSVYYYAGGVQNSYEIIKLNQYFWGKNYRTPSGYSIYPKNVTEIYFKIYTSLDTAILALQTGDVDYIAWSIPGSYVPELKSDPNINMFYSPQNGYYYLAFNMAQRPMNYLGFRVAVSHLIDKNTIVQDYMSGLGQPGDSNEPPFFTSWYNSSVVRYPYSPSNASSILNSSGFTIGPNGWRMMPNGQSMPQITILTPPADYDPIRVKIGEALAYEMSQIGINAVAKAQDFNTLVAEMSAYQYQMLTMGWSLSTDPIGNLADIYGMNVANNYEAFWPSNYTNPNFPNIKTLADNQTSQLAWQFNQVMNDALTTFNPNQQIFYTKWGQGILSEALPVNVLYYSINIEATLNVWQGWFSWQGSIYNIYALASIHLSSVSTGQSGSTSIQQKVGNIVFPKQVESINAVIIGSQKVLMNQPQLGVSSSASSVPVSVLVTNNFGLPVPNAHVMLSESGNGSVIIASSNGYTNTNGMFTTYITGKSPGYLTLRANVTYSGINAYTLQQIDVMYFVPNLIFINANIQNPSLMPGQSTVLTVTATNEYGSPVSNANVSIATNLIGYGTVTPSYNYTNATGIATFVYTAPSVNEMKNVYANSNLEGKLQIYVSAPGYTEENQISLTVYDYNPYPSIWDQIHVIGASSYFVNQNSLKTTIEVQAVNNDGYPISGMSIGILSSNSSYIQSYNSGITNLAGYANISITFNPGLKTAGISISFTNSTPYLISDSLTIAYVNGVIPSNLYGGYISFYNTNNDMRSNFVTDNENMHEMVVHIFNSYNMPVNGSVPMGFIVTSSSSGSLVGFSDPNWTTNWSGTGIPQGYMNSLWEFVGINLNTTYMGMLPTMSGIFVSQLDNQITDPYLTLTAFMYVLLAYGVYVNDSYITNGVGTFYLPGLLSPLTDTPITVYAIPYSYTYYPYTAGIYPPGVIVNGNFYTQGTEYLTNQIVVERASDVRIAIFNVNNSYGYSGGMMKVSAKLLNSTDVPQVNQSLSFYSKSLVPNPSYINFLLPFGDLGNAPVYTYTTNSNGMVYASLPLKKTTALISNPLYVAWNYMPGYPNPSAENSWGTATIVQSINVFTIPYEGLISVSSNTYTIPYNSTAIVTINAYDQYGNPISNGVVSLSSSTGTVYGSSKTNSIGMTTYYITPVNTSINGNPFTIDNIKIKLSGSVLGGVYYLTIVSYAPQPSAQYMNLMASQEITNSSYEIKGMIWSPAGIKNAVLYLDNPQNPFNVTYTEVSQGVYIWYANVSEFYSGLNAVFLNVTDNNNVNIIVPQFFYYQPVQYATVEQLNNTVTKVSHTLNNTTSSVKSTISSVQGGINNTLAVAILALIVALIAIGLSFRKPKQPKQNISGGNQTS
ncbi:MAG: ABC transporter substrate-binding protein [Thermoplasmata archaeon]